MTVFVAFMGNKGGIAKSSLARNIADGCARAGLRTIVIDADGQHTLTYTMQVDPVDALKTLLEDDNAEWADLLVPVPEEFSGCQHEFFYLLPTYEGLSQIEDKPGIPNKVYERFSELHGFADVVIVDSSPGRSNLQVGLYQTMTYVALPCECELESIMGLSATLNHLYTTAQTSPVAQVMGIIPTKFDATVTTHQVNYGFLLQQYSQHYPVFKPLRLMSVWKDAVMKRQSLFALSESKNYYERRKAKVAIGELQPILDMIIKAARA